MLRLFAISLSKVPVGHFGKAKGFSVKLQRGHINDVIDCIPQLWRLGNQVFA